MAVFGGVEGWCFSSPRPPNDMSLHGWILMALWVHALQNKLTLAARFCNETAGRSFVQRVDRKSWS